MLLCKRIVVVYSPDGKLLGKGHDCMSPRPNCALRTPPLGHESLYITAQTSVLSRALGVKGGVQY